MSQLARIVVSVVVLLDTHKVQLVNLQAPTLKALPDLCQEVVMLQELPILHLDMEIDLDAVVLRPASNPPDLGATTPMRRLNLVSIPKCISYSLSLFVFALNSHPRTCFHSKLCC